MNITERQLCRLIKTSKLNDFMLGNKLLLFEIDCPYKTPLGPTSYGFIVVYQLCNGAHTFTPGTIALNPVVALWNGIAHFGTFKPVDRVRSPVPTPIKEGACFYQEWYTLKIYGPGHRDINPLLCMINQ